MPWRCSLFALEAAAHQRHQRAAGLELAVQNGLHGLDDGHFDLILLGQAAGGGQCVDALNDLADLGLGLLHRLAAANQHTGVQVAAVHTRAGDDQVAHTGQARKGLGLAAHGDAQSGQLGVAAGDERGLGVVTVAQAQRNADSQRNDVLDRTAQLGAAAAVNI